MYRLGDLYYANLDSIPGSSIQSGHRPVLIVSNNTFNMGSTMVSIAPLTSKLQKSYSPTHVVIDGYGLKQKSLILLEQITCIDKFFLEKYIGTVSDSETYSEIKHAICIQYDINFAEKTSQ